MRTENEELKVKKGCFVVHPKGELHEFTTGQTEQYYGSLWQFNDFTYKRLAY